MARHDNTPGQMPLTHGLQVQRTADGNWVPANSGVAFPLANGTFERYRVDPKLLGPGSKLVAVQIQFKSVAVLAYSVGNQDGSSDLPSAANGGLATLEVQTFYQPIWLSDGEFFLQSADATQIVHYLLILRRRTDDERLSGD